MTPADLVPAVAATLAEHEWTWAMATPQRPVLVCKCGDTLISEWSSGVATLDDHRAHVAAALLAGPLPALLSAAEANAWEEAAELADTVIVSWSGVAGLHPEEPEPHPAAIAAAGARRTLVVLRSRVSEAFADRRDALAQSRQPAGEDQG